MLDLPGLGEKGDVSDWLDNGGTKTQLIELTKAQEPWDPEKVRPFDAIESFDDFDLPEFPADVLPRVLGEFVTALSHATETPVDMAGMLALAVCSAMLAKRVIVEPLSRWREPVNLFVAVLMEPGNRKSPVFSEVIAPVVAIEQELVAEAKPRIARAMSDRRQSEAKLKKLEKRAADKDDQVARAEALKLAEKLAKQAELVSPQLITHDATCEKLAMILAEQGGRIASVGAEGNVFDLIAGQYSKGVPQFNVYLQGHAGDSLRVDRVSRQALNVDRPALTCVYAVQPKVITALGKSPVYRDRGFLVRFLFAYPASPVGERTNVDEPVPTETRRGYEQLIRKLAAIVDEHVLTLSIGASIRFRLWRIKNEKMLADGGALEFLRDWGSKLPGAVLRLAGVLHCVEHGPEGAISFETIEAAIKIADYLVPHADAVLNGMLASGSQRDADAQYVLRWIKRKRKSSFSKRDVHQHGKRRFRRSQDLDQVLEELERRNYIRLQNHVVEGPGRPASPMYDVNPDLLDNAK